LSSFCFLFAEKMRSRMRRFFLVLSIALLMAPQSYAQCTECQSKLAYVADYCYSSPAFQGICIQFSEKQPNFLLQNGKKARYIPGSTSPSNDYFLSLAGDEKLKLTALEILFLQEAMKSWSIESRKFGYSYKESGLGVKILTQGTGELPVVGDRVTVHYTGWLEDGTKFDSSVDRGKPFAFSLGTGQVIKGWDEGIGLLSKGTRALLRIPAELGYGSIARGQIPANATLIFEVEVIQ